MEFFKPKPIWSFLTLAPIIYILFIFVFVLGSLFLSILLANSDSPPAILFLLVILLPIHFAVSIISVLNLIYAIVNAANNKVHTENEKITWIILIILLNTIVIPIYHYKYLRPTYSK